MVQTSWIIGFRGDATHQGKSTRRHARSLPRNASGHFSRRPKDVALATAKKFKTLIEHLKKKDVALAAAKKALGVAAKAVHSAQAGKWKSKR